MTPSHFNIVKHLTATLVAMTVAGLLVLGFDGLLGAMQKLTRQFAATPPPPAAVAPATDTVTTPGVVPAFVVPAEDAAPTP